MAKEAERVVQLFCGIQDDRSGNVAVLSAIMFLVLASGAALAVDYNIGIAAKAKMESVAEAAALAAATGLPDESDARAAAIAIAMANLRPGSSTPDVAESDVVVGSFDSSTRVFSAGASPVNAVQVVAMRSAANGNELPAAFGRLLGVDYLTVSASAVAMSGSSPVCMLALAPTGSKSLYLDSNANVDLSGCQVVVNSSDNEALYTDSNAQMGADKICVVGQHERKSSSSVTPAAQEGCDSVSDPYASLPAPSTSGCTFSGRVVDNQTTTLTPGRYCGGLTIKNNSNVTLSPGVYVIKTGDLLVDSNATLTGSGVTIYFAGSSTKMRLDSNSTISLTAPTSGTYSGILFFSASNNTSEMLIDSNSAGTLTGVLYFPKAKLKVNSNGQLGTASTCTQIVAWQIEFNSNGGLQTDFDASTCASGVQSGGSGSVSLVR